MQLVKQARIGDVLRLYNLLDGEVAKETKQAIFELLCFHNSEPDLIPEAFPEERSYLPDNEINRNIWKYV